MYRFAPIATSLSALIMGLALPFTLPQASHAGDLGFISAASSRATAIEPDHLLGDWKDDAWRRVVWQVQPGGKPDEFMITHYLEDGSTERMRGRVVSVKPLEDYLDMTPDSAANAPPGQAVPHVILKLKLTRTDAVSIGTPRRIRKEFQGKVAKSYLKLMLVPSRASKVLELTEGSTTISSTLASQGPLNVVLTATSDEVAKLLREHGNDNQLWQSEAKARTLAQRVDDDSQ